MGSNRDPEVSKFVAYQLQRKEVMDNGHHF